METLEYIREQLEKIISSKGILKKDLDKHIGVKQDTFSKFFTRQSLRMREFLNICEKLEVDPASLFPDREVKEDKYQEKYIKVLEDKVKLLEDKVQRYEKCEPKSKAS